MWRACFGTPDVPAQARERAVVVDCAETMRLLAPSTSPFIPIVRNDAVEQELGPVYRRFPCIAVRPRNAVERPAIELLQLGYDEFRDALADMGIARDAVIRLERESGRSPTILRRRLSKIPAIRTPPWAKDRETARSLVPIALVGVWHKGSQADCSALSTLSRSAYDQMEQRVAALRTLDDTPVWCVGEYRGVMSKIDVLFAVSASLTESDVDDFVQIAEYILSETDPGLTLPEDRRWAAATYGKVRSHSAELRASVGETLVLLAVHGDHLLRGRLGVDVEGGASGLVARLLSPMTGETLLSHEHDLPLYAEAAPAQFLQLLDEDLKKPQPAVLALLTPAGHGLFAAPRRNGLLGGLACLAWSPQHLPRVARILARLAKDDIDDNWHPTPFSILAAVLHSWTPQTAASVEDRVRCLQMIVRHFPAVGWRLCVEQLRGSAVFVPNRRPRWRADAAGFGTGVSREENGAFTRAALDLAFDWRLHDQDTLGDLVEHQHKLVTDQDRQRVWELVDRFAQSAADDRAKSSAAAADTSLCVLPSGLGAPQRH